MDSTPNPAEVAAQPEQPKTQAESVAEDLAQQKAQYEVDKLAREIGKLNKETEKVELELRDLRRHWLKRPLVIAAFLPALIAVGTLTVGYKTGWFQAESIRLENKKHDLNQDVAKLENDKAVLDLERTAMLRRLGVERTSMQERLASERSANKYRIDSERNKAELLVAAAREQAQQEKRRLEELARKVSFEALFKALEGDRRIFHFPPKPGIVNNTDTVYYRESAAATAASYVMVTILKKDDKRAAELHAALAHKVQLGSKLAEAVTGLYLYTLYKGTGNPAWKTQFLTKAQLIADRLRTQSPDSDDDDISGNEYLNLISLPDWSDDDKEEIALFLTKYTRQLTGQPGKQSDVLYLFAHTLLPTTGFRSYSFCRRHPREFVYLLQLARDIIVAPSNFPATNSDFNSDRLNGPELWLSTYAPVAMIAVLAHVLITYPYLADTGQGTESTAGSNPILVDKMFRNTAEGMITSNTRIEVLYHLPKYEIYKNPNTEGWKAWNASHPQLSFWLTPNLSFLADKPEELFKRVWSDNGLDNN